LKNNNRFGHFQGKETFKIGVDPKVSGVKSFKLIAFDNIRENGLFL